MKTNKKIYNPFYFIFLLVIILSCVFLYIFSINSKIVEPVDITFENINSHFLNKIYPPIRKTDAIPLNSYTKDTPLKIGVEYDYIYYYNKDNNIYGLNLLVINILEKYFDIPIYVENIKDTTTDYDLVLTHNPNDFNLENFTKSDINLNTNLYLYSKDYIVSIPSSLENSIVYIPNLYKEQVSKKAYELSETLSFEILYVEDDFDYIGKGEENSFFINNNIYGLENNLPYYINLPFNIINYRENIYFNRNVDNDFIELVNILFKEEEVQKITTDYFYTLLELEASDGKFYTEDELNLIKSSQTLPLFFENIENQSSLDYFSKADGKWKGPLISLWEKISKTSKLRYIFTVNEDISLESFQEGFEKTPSTIDGTFTLINPKKQSNTLNMLNIGYESTIVFIGFTEDLKIYDTNSLWGKKVGVSSVLPLDENIQEIYSGLDVAFYDNIYLALEDLEDEKIDLIGTTYEEYQNLFLKEKKYNLELKKITPIDVYYTSGIAKNISYSDTLYSLVSKTLLTINVNEVFSEYMLNNSSFLNRVTLMEKNIKILSFISMLTTTFLLLITSIFFRLRIKYKNNNASLSVLENLAFEDSLTSLKNNIAFLNDVENDLLTGTFFVINVNDFRNIDLQFSHKVGNFVLKSLAYSLLSFSIETDMQVYRVGNDTFSLISKKPLDEKTITEISDKLFSLLEKPIELRENDKTVHLTIRIGVSNHTEIQKAEETYYKAESASINAKQLLIEGKKPLVINF